MSNNQCSFVPYTWHKAKSNNGAPSLADQRFYSTLNLGKQMHMVLHVTELYISCLQAADFTFCPLTVNCNKWLSRMDTRLVILNLALLVGLAAAIEPYNEDNYDHRRMYLYYTDISIAIMMSITNKRPLHNNFSPRRNSTPVSLLSQYWYHLLV